MKRTLLMTLTLMVATTVTAPAVQACCYIPWLDPLAWLGFYGCGCGYPGYGYGYGASAYGYGAPAYGYGAPAYGYGATGYGVQQPCCGPTAGYQPAPAPVAATGYYGAAVPPPAVQAVQVPVTTYRPVTQYVPQTTWQTQYRYAAPSVAYGVSPPAATYSPAPAVAYAPQAIQQQAVIPPTTIMPPTVYQPGGFPQGVYGQATSPPAIQTPQMFQAPSTTYPYQPQGVPDIATPSGDINGDHEYPTQSYSVPAPVRPIVPSTYSYTQSAPIRRTSYGVTPRSARRYPSAIR